MTTDLATRPALTLTAWEPPDTMTFNEWAAAGQQLGVMGRAVQWWVGDWVNHGEQAFGEKYTQAIEDTGLPHATLSNYAWVAAHIPPSRRRETLSWSHHAETAALEPTEADRLLDQAETDGLSVHKLRTRVRAARQVTQGDTTGQDETQQYRTTLTFDHNAGDHDDAQAAIRRLVDQLEARGMRVTEHTTTPSRPLSRTA